MLCLVPVKKVLEARSAWWPAASSRSPRVAAQETGAARDQDPPFDVVDALLLGSFASPTPGTEALAARGLQLQPSKITGCVSACFSAAKLGLLNAFSPS